MKKVKATRTEKLPQTTKKQKFIGFKEFVDVATGEVIPMQINQVEDRDFNFTKVWLQMFVNGLDRIANKKMKLAFWIIDNLNKENQLICTFKKMAEETGLSEYTVIMTMRELQRGDPPFLKKLQSGVYQVNPDILYKGSHQSRMGIIYKFGNVSTKAESEFATDTTTTESTGTVEDTETTVADTMTETTTTESATAETTIKRKGRVPKSKPSNWAEVREKIIAKKITKIQALKELGIKSANTLKKWLAEE